MLPPLRHLFPQLSGKSRAALNFLIPHSGLLVCGLFLLVGLALADDYGGDYGDSGVDNRFQIDTVQDNLNYILGRADSVATPTYHDRAYSVAFELPLLLAQQYLGAARTQPEFAWSEWLDQDPLGSAISPDTFSVRFFLTHLFFIVAAGFCYRLAYRLFNNRLLAILALLFFLLHPRLYNHSYINTKDLPFLSMLMIALYLLERAFRRDTWGAFILLGIGVGLLTNLRIMGIMLFAAPLAMRGLDLFYAGSWAQRRGILLTAGLFLLAGGLTLYALAPFAWTNPVEYLLVNLAITVEHSTIVPVLFQGERILNDELPPQYTAVWFGITTPPLFLLLGGLGAAAVVAAGLRRPGAVFRNTRLRFAGLLLACFLLPALAATVLGSVQQDNWRHLYFLYAPFCLLAVYGLHWLGSAWSARRGRAATDRCLYLPSRCFADNPTAGRAGVYGLAGAGLILIVLQMTQIHPMQDSYFNFLVDRTTPEYLRTQYEVGSLNVKIQPIRDYLEKRHPGETLSVLGYWRDRHLAGTDPDADYALFYIWDDGYQDLAFNALPVGRLYNNTIAAVKPLKDSRMTESALAAYREFYRKAVAGEPIIRAAYDVYLAGRTVTFVRENCSWDAQRRQVFVKVLLPDLEVFTGTAYYFPSHGVRIGELCLAVVQVPAYAQGDLIIGQDYADAGRWAELYSLDPPGLLERIARARQKNRQPALRQDFDVFLETAAGGRQRLLYAKPDCAPGDNGTPIFLHIFPVNPAELPPYTDTTNSGYAVREYYLRQLGNYRVGPAAECLAVVALPDYPSGIREIRTGQPDRWHGSIFPPADPDPLRQAYAALAPIPPDRRADFDVYWQDGHLTYLRESCAAADTVNPFFLHIFLVDDDLLTGPPADRDNRDFEFGRWGGHFDGKCLAAVPLPDYPIAAIKTGQYAPEQGAVWTVNLIAPADPAPLRAAWAAAAEGQLLAQDYFDLYELDNRLFFRRENCAAADATSPFFLYVVPENVVDLPEELQADGSEWLGFDLPQRGGRFDDKCLAAIPLPDYPIKEISAGQYIPDQGNLWSVELVTPANPEELRADYAALSGVQPAVRDYFDLYQRDNRLLYLRESCAAEDTAAKFFLHIIPEEITDLPAEGQGDGIAWSDFNFARQGGHFDGKCLATVALPDHPGGIKEIHTGQYISGQGNLWSVELIAAADPDKLRADYAALSDLEPAARNYFDLYRQDSRLLYLRESCAATDTAAKFFLHIIPENVADLPVEWQGDGAAWSEFALIRQGGIFDGKCLATVALPDYPIKEIRTGQHIPGQGHLWLAELITATAPDKLRAIYAALSDMEPVARNYFDLYLLGHQLIYLRESCTAADTAAYFFRHIIPEDFADLPEQRRNAGFAYGGFNFVRQGGHFDGKCLAAVALPDYPVKELRTGQYIPDYGDLWSVALITPADPDQLRADYAALSTMEPAVRNYFDLYWRDNRLFYLRENCTDADTAAPFFLQIVPADVADLPEEWRAGGLGYGDFAFVRRGGRFDGKCLATVALPHYPIKEIRTGQHIPGQGAPLWLVELTDAP